MTESKNKEGRIAVLLSQVSATRISGGVPETTELAVLCEGLTFAEKRKIVREMNIDVSEVVRKNINERDIKIKKRRR